ncbi:hypothetical protein [Actinomadura verrucosospora]
MAQRSANLIAAFQTVHQHSERLRTDEEMTGLWRFASFETDSIAAVSALPAGDIGANRSGYACPADRDHLKKVEILWDQPSR